MFVHYCIYLECSIWNIYQARFLSEICSALSCTKLLDPSASQKERNTGRRDQFNISRSVDHHDRLEMRLRTL